MTLAASLAASLWLAATPTTAPTQKISVEVRGPIALVQVTRPLVSDGTPGGERILDLALPEHAALVDVELADGDMWRAAEITDAARATSAYVDRLATRGVTPAREPFDEGARFRLRALGAPGAAMEARYRFAILPETTDGRGRIRFPASPDRVPLPADVTVSTGGQSTVEIAGVGTAFIAGSPNETARARVPARGAWEISWEPPALPPARPVTLAGGLAFARLSATETIVAVSAEARGRRPREPPPNVLLLVDRSRSVGLPGLAAERDLARKLLEALPPATRFDALFFDRGVRRLFPMSRPATREALGALDAELVPDRLRNGTDLAGALREAGALLRREASAFAPRTLLVLITDGALAERTDGAALVSALGAAPDVELPIAAFVVRPKGDDPAPRAATSALGVLAAAHAGVLRVLATDELDDGLAPALAALAAGGDVASVRLVAGGAEHALAERLAPGEGHAALFTLASLSRGAELAGTNAGGRLRAPLRPRKVDATWLRALRDDAAHARLLTTDGLVALVEPVPVAAAPPPAVKGSLDRTVVRNTLSLAFMPRARACYLSRRAATPAERDLAGRVRLAIDLTRGEVGDVTVQSSTLNHPEIEACLREGAFALEVPRALRSDAPSTAVLNLVFRPRTPEKHETPDEAALGAQIDLVIEGLHRTEPSPETSPTPDRSMIPTR